MQMNTLFNLKCYYLFNNIYLLTFYMFNANKFLIESAVHSYLKPKVKTLTIFLNTSSNDER